MMSYLSIASLNGCAYTAWGPCFCCETESLCKSCKTANKIEDLGLDWDVEFNKAESNGFKDPDYLMEGEK